MVLNIAGGKKCAPCIWAATIISTFIITNITNIRADYPMNIPRLQETTHESRTDGHEQNEPKNLHTTVNKARGKK